MNQLPGHRVAKEGFPEPLRHSTRVEENDHRLAHEVVVGKHQERVIPGIVPQLIKGTFFHYEPVRVDWSAMPAHCLKQQFALEWIKELTAVAAAKLQLSYELAEWHPPLIEWIDGNRPPAGEEDLV